jgi:hypothetical protein
MPDVYVTRSATSEKYRDQLRKLAQEVATLGSDEHPVNKIEYMKAGPSITIKIYPARTLQVQTGSHSVRRSKSSAGIINARRSGK